MMGGLGVPTFLQPRLESDQSSQNSGEFGLHPAQFHSAIGEPDQEKEHRAQKGKQREGESMEDHQHRIYGTNIPGDSISQRTRNIASPATYGTFRMWLYM